MLLRICLILAIVTGLGVIGVSQFMLKPQIEKIVEDRDHNKTEWDKSAKELVNNKKKLKDTSEKLTKTESNLEETKTQLTATAAKFETEQKRANGLQDNVAKLTVDLKSAKDELFRWDSVGVKVEEIKALVASNKKLNGDNDALKEENKFLHSEVKKKDLELTSLKGQDDQAPFVPREIRGKVLVVDPKWNFLVLDVGKNIGVPENGVLLISRNGELVAKVRVMNTEDKRSIANIMPGWKLKEVMEGDVVLPY